MKVRAFKKSNGRCIGPRVLKSEPRYSVDGAVASGLPYGWLGGEVQSENEGLGFAE
jgi:hypothetical protein